MHRHKSIQESANNYSQRSETSRGGVVLFFSFGLFVPVLSFTFICYIRKDIVSKLDKSAAQMENSHHFPPKVISGKMVFTPAVQRGWGEF